MIFEELTQQESNNLFETTGQYLSEFTTWVEETPRPEVKRLDRMIVKELRKQVVISVNEFGQTLIELKPSVYGKKGWKREHYLTYLQRELGCSRSTAERLYKNKGGLYGQADYTVTNASVSLVAINIATRLVTKQLDRFIREYGLDRSMFEYHLDDVIGQARYELVLKHGKVILEDNKVKAIAKITCQAMYNVVRRD